jgi:hypothetical protein
MTAYTFDQLFDFTRATAGTFVGSNGLIQNTPASVNLLTFTQEFDNAAWVKQAGTSISANAASAPDGTLTADAFVKGSGTTGAADLYRDAGVSALGVPSLLSIFVKANGIPAVRITGGGSYSPNGQSRFDLVSGTVVAGGGSITAFGNGWYRCVISLTRTSTADNSVYIAPCNVDGTFPVGNGVSGILLWGAQLEAGSTATTYTRNNGGVFPARFEYDPVTLQPRGLLVEEQRTNLALYSEQFDNAAWTKFNATVTANATVSPDGTANADKLVEDATASAGHLISQGPTLTAVAHTYSVYAKASERNWICLLNNSIANALAFFNLATGTIGTVGSGATATITNVGNGWYRCSVTFTAIAATNNCHIRLAPSDNVLSYNGVAGSGAFIYGAQLEAGTFATSYIPTVASQVTRSPDICNITAPMFAPWYNQPAGTFVVEVGRFSSVPSTALATLISVTDNPLTNDWILMFGDNAGTTSNYTSAGVGQASLYVATSISAGGKTGFAYAANDFAAAVNGGAVTTDTSGTLNTDLTVLRIGGFAANPNYLNGHIRRVTYYPFRASNNQLQALTT